MMDSSQETLVHPDVPFERTVISASRWKLVFPLLFCLILLFMALNSVDRDPNSEGYYFHLLAGWAIDVILGTGTLIVLLMIILKRPKIILDHNGLHLIEVYYEKFWKWSDVGPFSNDVQYLQGATAHYICAFTDHNHDLMAFHNRPQQPDCANADISLRLNALPVGKNADRAKEFAELLNAWRDQFGRPEIEVSSEGTAAKAQGLINKIKSKDRRNWILIFLAPWIAFLAFEGIAYIIRLLSSP